MKLSASTPFKSTLKSTTKTSSPFAKPAAKETSSSKTTVKKKVVPLEEETFELPEYTSPVVQKRSPVLALTGSMSSTLPDSIKAETFLDESEGNEDRWKNQRANTNVMAQPTELTSQISKKKIRGLTTMFGQRADIILQLLEDDSQTDGALTLIQRTLLQTMVDVLPVVERSVRTSRGQRGVYQLNQCISQIRELTTDIQSLRDRGQLGASVVERTLRPAYLDLAVQISLAITEIDNSAKSMMSPSDHATYRQDTLIPMKRNLATFVQQQYQEVKEGVTNGLS